MLGLATLLKTINHEAQRAREQNYAHNMSTEEAVASIKRARSARRGVGSKLGKLAKAAMVCTLLSMGGHFVINHLDNNGSQVSQFVQTGVAENPDLASKYFDNDIAKDVSFRGDQFKQVLMEKADQNNYLQMRNVPDTDIIDVYPSQAMAQNNPEANAKANTLANLAISASIKEGKYTRFSKGDVDRLGLKVIREPLTGRAMTITKEMYADGVKRHFPMIVLKTDEMSGNVIPEDSTVTRSISDMNADFSKPHREDFVALAHEKLAHGHKPSHPQHHSNLPDNSFGIGMGN